MSGRIRPGEALEALRAVRPFVMVASDTEPQHVETLTRARALMDDALAAAASGSEAGAGRMADRPGDPDAAVIAHNVAHIARGCRSERSHEPEWYMAEIQAALDRIEARLSVYEQALRELESVPNAGPFPNNAACAAFASYVQGVARAALTTEAG